MTETEYTDMVRRLASIDEKVSLMNSRLFGNGQPGEIQKHDTRLTAAEVFIDRATGALWLMGGIMSLVTGSEVLRLMKVIQ